jgi:protoporphyrinogen oxidase
VTKTLFFIVVVFFAISAGATTDEGDIKYSVLGGDAQSFDPSGAGLKQVKDKDQYDVVIVGGGLGGLTSGIYLSKRHLKVLLLEKEADVGGLASGRITSDGIITDRGAAYWTSSYDEEQAILEDIGLGDYETDNPIKEPADTYFVRGKLYPGIWDESLDSLPASFALFKFELKKENDENLIPNQPLEENDVTLDNRTAAQWINEMPGKIKGRYDAIPQSVKDAYHKALEDKKDFKLEKENKVIPVWEHFQAERKSLRGEQYGMDDVMELMDLYCRSALGTDANGVSALAFANFYISEIDTRYTTAYGTAKAAMNMVDLLNKATPAVTIKRSSPVVKIWNKWNGAVVAYENNKELHEVKAKYVVFAAQVGLAPKLIDNFSKMAPEKADVISKMKYANYSVHSVDLKGHPYKLSYDTWVHASDYSRRDFTDVITTEWIATNGFTTPPQNEDHGIFTVYHPISNDWYKVDQNGKDVCDAADPLCISKKYSDVDAIKVAKYAVHRLFDLFAPMFKEQYGTDLVVTSVETNRWPISVHIATPGHFSHDAKFLRQRVGHIYFANNNIGTPAFEEALFRGHCAADNVLRHYEHASEIDKDWKTKSFCPIEK